MLLAELLAHIYSIALLVLWALFLWKTLTPRRALKPTMAICAAAIAAVYAATCFLPRPALLRLFLFPALFILLGFFLYRSKPVVTVLAAVIPQLIMLLADMLLRLLYPNLSEPDGYARFWRDPIAPAIALLLLLLFAFVLSLVNRLFVKKRRAMSLVQWLVFSIFPAAQAFCLGLLFHEYFRDPTGIHPLAITAMILLFAVTDVSLFHIIKETARRAELEATNRLLKNQLDSQLKHYKALASQYEDNRRTRHDIAHHMHTIRLLLEKSQHAEAVNYAGQLIRQQQSYNSQLGQCQNPILDAFLCSRLQEAQRLNIPVEASVVLPAEVALPNTDLVILFGNVLDNAIAACTRAENPFIKLDVHLKDECLTVTQSNPAPTEKKRRLPHTERGMGLYILEDLAKRHSGTCVHSTQDGVFSISITLQLDEVRNGGACDTDRK